MLMTQAARQQPVPINCGRGSFESGSSDGGFHLKWNGGASGEYAWTALILRHANSGQARQALTLYEEMREEGGKPRPRILVAMLKACVRLQDLETAKRVHAEVVRSGLETDLYVGTVLVNVYAKCGSLEDARRVFEEMLHRDVVSWTAMILGYARRGRGDEALQLFARMQEEGVVPDVRAYVGALKACSTVAELAGRNGGDEVLVRKQCLETVRAMHADFEKGELVRNVIVGNVLVDAYAKCGSLVEARWVFERMPYRDVVSWNSMMRGYTQNGEGEEALRLYGRMGQEGIVPNDRTHVAALKACSAIADMGSRKGRDRLLVKRQCLETVTNIHADVRKSKVELDGFVGTMLISAYAKCGSLENARRVFEEMPHGDVMSWTAMILAYVEMEKSEEALQLYTQMRQKGIVADEQAYVGALKACSAIGELREGNGSDSLLVAQQQCLETVRAIHRDIEKQKLETNLVVGSTLVDAYAKCGSLENARRVFENMPQRSVVSWTAMIHGYAQMQAGEEALHLYTRMAQEGVVPNDRTYVAALKACSAIAEMRKRPDVDGFVVKQQCLETVTSIHAKLGKSNSELDVFVGTTLVDAYAKCGSLENARQVFEELPDRDVVCWTAMILGYGKMGMGEEALEMYTRMQLQGMASDSQAYIGTLKACSVIAELVENNGHDGLKRQCLETVDAIHSEVGKGNFQLNLFVGNMLLNAYAKCGSLERARQVFEVMPNHDVVSWTTMILGYSQLDRGEEALQLFARMQQEGVVPNYQTFVAALNACGSIAGLEKGKEIHAQILKAGLEGGSFVTISLIDMYGKCSSMVNAQQVFDAMGCREAAAWNSLIVSYARHGESGVVFDLFKRMEEEDVKPDHITFLGVLIACSHGGALYRGQEYFEAMSREYGLSPTIQHYTCMVDLLGRAGQVSKAMEMVKTMPFQPDITMWKCVLGACRKWGNVELGRQAFECAVRIDKRDAAAYTLMSNMYRAVNMPEEADQIQVLRAKSGAWKEPGRSWWVDMRGKSHIFLAGGRAHSESQDVYVELEDLLVQAKRQGYIPQLNSLLQDMPEEEEEATVCTK